LGDGSSDVCDDTPPTTGGVPAVSPADFSPIQSVANAINDLACRFKDGFGSHNGITKSTEACTTFDDGLFHFKEMTSRIQFCGQINEPLIFPTGDTVVTARVRDIAGHVSFPSRIVVRISPRP
jgi:hypothetical protein